MRKDLIAFSWLVMCHVFNFSDVVFTLYAISHGVEEANPVMAWALSVSPLFFVVLKLTLFALAIDFIAKRKPCLLKWIAVLLMCVTAWHINFAYRL